MFDDVLIVIVLTLLFCLIALGFYAFVMQADVGPQSYEMMTVSERIMSERLVAPW